MRDEMGLSRVNRDGEPVVLYIHPWSRSGQRSWRRRARRSCAITSASTARSTSCARSPPDLPFGRSLKGSTPARITPSRQPQRWAHAGIQLFRLLQIRTRPLGKGYRRQGDSGVSLVALAQRLRERLRTPADLPESRARAAPSRRVADGLHQECAVRQQPTSLPSSITAA